MFLNCALSLPLIGARANARLTSERDGRLPDGCKCSIAPPGPRCLKEACTNIRRTVKIPQRCTVASNKFWQAPSDILYRGQHVQAVQKLAYGGVSAVWSVHHHVGQSAATGLTPAAPGPCVTNCVPRLACAMDSHCLMCWTHAANLDSRIVSIMYGGVAAALDTSAGQASHSRCALAHWAFASARNEPQRAGQIAELMH